MAYNTELPINESPGPAASSARVHAELSPRISTTIGRASRNTGQWWGASCAPGVQTPGVGSYDTSKAWKRASSWYGSCSRSSQSARMLKSRDACLHRGEFVYCDLMGPSFDAGLSHSHCSSDSNIIPRRSRSNSPGPGAYNTRYGGLSSSYHSDIAIARSVRGPCLARGEFLVRDLRHTQREVGSPTASGAPSSPSSPGTASLQAARRTPSRGTPHAAHPWLDTPKGSKTAQIISQRPYLKQREASGGRSFRPPSRSSSALQARGGTPMASSTPKGSGALKGTGAPVGTLNAKGLGHAAGLPQPAAPRAAAAEVPVQPPAQCHLDELSQGGANGQDREYELQPRQLLWEQEVVQSQPPVEEEEEESPRTRSRKKVSLQVEPVEDQTPQGQSEIEQVQLDDLRPQRSSASQAAELPLRAPSRSSASSAAPLPQVQEEDGQTAEPRQRAASRSYSPLAIRRRRTLQEEGQPAEPQLHAPSGPPPSSTARRPTLEEELLQREGGARQQDAEAAELHVRTPSRSSSSFPARQPAPQEEQPQREGALEDGASAEMQLRTRSRAHSSFAAQPAQRSTLQEDSQPLEPQLHVPSRSSVPSAARRPAAQEAHLQKDGQPTEPQPHAPSRSSVPSAARRPDVQEEHPQKEQQAPPPSSGRGSRSRGSSQRLSVHEAEWQVKQDNRWQDLSADTCRLLLEAEAAGQMTIEVSSGIGMYLFNLDAMTQLNLKTKRVRQLRRRNPAQHG